MKRGSLRRTASEEKTSGQPALLLGWERSATANPRFSRFSFVRCLLAALRSLWPKKKKKKIPLLIIRLDISTGLWRGPRGAMWRGGNYAFEVVSTIEQRAREEKYQQWEVGQRSLSKNGAGLTRSKILPLSGFRVELFLGTSERAAKLFGVVFALDIVHNAFSLSGIPISRRVNHVSKSMQCTGFSCIKAPFAKIKKKT